MIFPNKSDYPNNFGILDSQNPTQTQLYSNLIEASASAYFESDPFSRYFLKKKFYHAESLLAKKNFGKTLDAGTGIGFFIPYLSIISKDVVGVDRTGAVLYAREMIKKRHILNATVDQYDLMSLPYPDSTFDCVVSLSTLDNFTEIQLKIVLSLFKRILKPGGFLVVGYSTENSFFRFLHNKLSFFFGKRLKTRQILDASKIGHSVFANPVSSGKQIEMLAENNFNFKKIDNRTLNLTPLFDLYKVTVFCRE